MSNLLFRLGRFLDFYRKAVTKYQLHSPFVFELVHAVLEDRRWFYAFRDVERVRRKMLASDTKLEVVDYGVARSDMPPPAPPMGGRSASPPASGTDTNAGSNTSALTPASDSNARGTTPLPPTGGAGGGTPEGGFATVRLIARRAASSMAQGRMLFRLANWAAPKTMLELGTSLGIGAMYLASGMRSARLVTLEGCPDFAKIARANLAALDLKNTEVMTGRFEDTLPETLERLHAPDLVFFDGNHRPEPTLAYFETCLPYAHAGTVFVFDDAYWSPGMARAWNSIREHPRVTLTVDFYDLSLAFINPDFKEKQHFRVVPARWKPWRFF